MTNILTGQFVESADLIPENLDVPEQVQHTITVSYLVPSSPSRPKRNEVIDVVTWVEYFVSLMSVVTTYAPQRSHDMLAYMSLILRTAKRFGGHAWLNYDRAFRQETAASALENWSMIWADL